MSTDDLLRSDVDYAVDGLFAETVYYKSLSGRAESTVPWTTLSAVVERAADPRGMSAEIGRSPILVVVSKTDLTAVVPQVDKLKYAGRVYSVAQIASEDSGAFELYCVP